jgi:hypothetical protein
MKELRERIEAARADALRVYEIDLPLGGVSSAYDSGRYDGLKQAIEILDDLARSRGRARVYRHV